jgi:hypothetical protein
MPRSTKKATPATRPTLPPQVRKMQQMRQQMQHRSKLPTMTAHARRTP